jgi:phage/plasmid-associated DNA primase
MATNDCMDKTIMDELREQFGNDYIRVKDPLNQKQARYKGIYHYNGKYWKEDTGLEDKIFDIFDKNDIKNEGRKNRLYRNFLEGIAKEPNIDAKHLLVTPDGVIDFDVRASLKKENLNNNLDSQIDKWLLPHDNYKKRYLTMCTTAKYRPDYKEHLSTFFRFLYGSLYQDSELGEWLLLFLGGTLVGELIHKQFAYFLGKTNTGKTTLSNFIVDILGEYASVLNDETFSFKDSSKLLFGRRDKRLLIYSEPSSKKNKYNIETLKKITGNSKFSANDKDFSFSGKIIIDSNYPFSYDTGTGKPDEAIEDRLVEVAFVSYFPNKEAAKETIDKLNPDAVFSLMVNKADDYLASKKTKPAISNSSREIVRMFNDPVTKFYTTVCKSFRSDNDIPAEEIYELFQVFVEKYMKEWTLRQTPFLSDSMVTIEIPSLNKFNDIMRQNHTYTRRREVGLCFYNIFCDKSVSHWQESLAPFFKTPENSFAVNVLKEVDDCKAKLETFSEPQRFQKEVMEAIGTKQESMQEYIGNNPYSAMQAMQTMAINGQLSPYFMPYFMPFPMYQGTSPLYQPPVQPVPSVQPVPPAPPPPPETQPPEIITNNDDKYSGDYYMAFSGKGKTPFDLKPGSDVVWLENPRTLFDIPQEDS